MARATPPRQVMRDNMAQIASFLPAEAGSGSNPIENLANQLAQASLNADASAKGTEAAEGGATAAVALDTEHVHRQEALYRELCTKVTHAPESGAFPVSPCQPALCGGCRPASVSIPPRQPRQGASSPLRIPRWLPAVAASTPRLSSMCGLARDSPLCARGHCSACSFRSHTARRSPPERGGRPHCPATLAPGGRSRSSPSTRRGCGGCGTCSLGAGARSRMAANRGARGLIMRPPGDIVPACSISREHCPPPLHLAGL